MKEDFCLFVVVFEIAVVVVTVIVVAAVVAVLAVVVAADAVAAADAISNELFSMRVKKLLIYMTYLLNIIFLN